MTRTKAGLGGKRVLYGGAAYVVGVVQFFLCVAVAASHYGPPSYSPLRNTISDLQAVSCGIFLGNQVCSPLHAVANASVAVLGLMLVSGSLLVRSAFPAGRNQTTGVGLLVAAGVATFVNAFSPEDVTLAGDIVTALVAFLCANFGLIQIGRGMTADSQWTEFRLFSEVLGIVGLASLVLGAADPAGPLGPGGNEWLVISPVLVWAFAVGIILLGPKHHLASARRWEHTV